MLVFVEGGKPEYPEKNPRSRDENQQQTQPTYDAETGNRTRATLVGGECSHHCAISAPLNWIRGRKDYDKSVFLTICFEQNENLTVETSVRGVYGESARESGEWTFAFVSFKQEFLAEQVLRCGDSSRLH